MTWAFGESITWQPSVGDPTVRGWLTAAAAVVVGVLALRHARALRGAARPMRVFWAVTGAVLVILGVSKQLGVQSLVGDVGRELSRDQGWWESRRAIQGVLVLASVAVAVVILVVVVHLLGPDWRRCGLAVVGLAWLAAFIALRAISSHRLDRVFDSGAAGLDVKWAGEAIGIALVFVGLMIDLRRAPTDVSRRRAPSAA